MLEYIHFWKIFSKITGDRMDLLSDEIGKKELLLGNEAIVRGAIEGGCALAATYPGTPSSEIGNTLHKIAKDAGMFFEFSANEAVALEVAAGAAVAGVRSFAFMKHVGLNVAADAFMTIAYTGVRGGLVVLSADDPQCHSSQNEQDNRYYAKISGVPMIEPSTPAEAKEMMIFAFDLSDRLEVPVLFRTTTRLNHVKGIVEYGEKKEVVGKVKFEKDPHRFVTVPANARKGHLRLLAAMEKMKEETEICSLNYTVKPKYGNNENGTKVGIITSGVTYNYIMELLENVDLDIDASVLKLGMTNPLPESMILDFADEHELLIIIEELEPFLEDSLLALLKHNRRDIDLKGKRDGHFPRAFEFNPDIVYKGMLSALDSDAGMVNDEEEGILEWKKLPEPPRPPVLCPGCPHRGAYFAVKKATRGKAIHPMDIGCYTLGIMPPQSIGDILVCMGSSAGSAGGISRVIDEPVIAHMGDSTFFHTGIPALVNAVHNRHNIVLNIMDNSTTAMTGHQPHPGLPIDGMGDPAVALDVTKVCEGLGVEFIRTVDPLKVKETTQAFKEALEFQGAAVVITKSPCALLIDRAYRKKGKVRTKYTVDQEKCRHCNLCTRQFACPAFYVKDNDHFIDPAICLGCGVCAQVCPFGAMVPMKEEVKE